MDTLEEQQFKQYMESRINDVRLETYDQAMTFLRNQLLNRLPDSPITKKEIDSEIRYIMKQWSESVKKSRTYH